MNRKALLISNLSAVAIIAAVMLWLCVLPKAQATNSAPSPVSAQNQQLEIQQEPTAAEEQAIDPQQKQNTASNWLLSTATSTGIPTRALQAYVNAAKQLKQEDPHCGLAWNTLAAIGFAESAHANGQLEANGDANPKIIGPVLNGNGFAAIPDSDGGVFDGDSRWDRAVGPLQFIPQTWQRYARDGNADGVANPQNIDDAALSAATYLCTAAFESGNTGMKTAAGWSHAILAYNQSAVYLDSIYQAANRYAKLSSQ